MIFLSNLFFPLGVNRCMKLYFSQEEIESLRERMSAQTSLVVVGSADDALRINKFNRHLEGVTQSMVDNMIAVRKRNEIFVSKKINHSMHFI